MKNILVTGGAGFIGSNLIKRLFKDVKGATIVNIDNMNAYYDVSLKDYRLKELETLVPEGVNYKFVKGDIADKALVDSLFAEYKLYVHCYSKLYNIPSTGLRFFTVYGPAGRPDMAYFGFTNKLLRGETIQIYN